MFAHRFATFQADDYDEVTGGLLPNAVPTLHLPMGAEVNVQGATRQSTCAVLGCIPERGTKYHRVPNKDNRGRLDPRRADWLRVCQIDPNDTRARLRVCRKHFLDSDYELTSNNKMQLVAHAIPSLHLPPPTVEEDMEVEGEVQGQDEEVQMEQDYDYEDYDRSANDAAVAIGGIGAGDDYAPTDDSNGQDESNDEEESESEEEDVEAQLQEAEGKVSELKKKLKTSQQKVRRQSRRGDKKGVVKTRRQVRAYLRKMYAPSWVNFIMGNKKYPTNKWLHHEIVDALVLRQKIGQKGYQFIRDRNMAPLPSVSTLRNRIKHFKVEAGILDSCLALVKKKLDKETKEEDTVAILSFDEVSVDGAISFDQRQQRFLKSSTKMQVAILRGLKKNWKIPVFCDFDCPMTGTKLDDIIIACEASGAKVFATVNDMAPDNVNLWSQKGVDYKNVSFKNPADSSRDVYCFADAPHALKLLRNHLWDHGFLLPDGRSTVRKETLEALYAKVNDPGRQEFRPQFKLTQAHFDVYGAARQRVITATETISRTTSKALLMMAPEMGEDLLVYSEFISLFDQWFDVQNSRSKTNPKSALKGGYGGDALAQQKEVLTKTYSYVTSMRQIWKWGPYKKHPFKVRKSLLPFQKGIAQSSLALQLLWDDLKKRYPAMKYILTARDSIQ